MNKRITAKVAKRRANSPQMVERRRWMLELVTAQRAFEAMENVRMSPFGFSEPAAPSQNVLHQNYVPTQRPVDNQLLVRNWKKHLVKL